MKGAESYPQCHMHHCKHAPLDVELVTLKTAGSGLNGPEHSQLDGEYALAGPRTQEIPEYYWSCEVDPILFYNTVINI